MLVFLSLSLVFCCFQHVSGMHSHLLSSLNLDMSKINLSTGHNLHSITSCNNSILIFQYLVNISSDDHF